jgi:3D-(3,5/4)-trihydroxycyclohexane-1,2-dione acylhydrolase (decyclizing)
MLGQTNGTGESGRPMVLASRAELGDPLKHGASPRDGDHGDNRLTAAQATVRYLAAHGPSDGAEAPLAPASGPSSAMAMWPAGEALYQARESLPTFRAHNEQAMALAAVAFAKAKRRRQMMACTSSIGPAPPTWSRRAVAHVDRLPLLLPGDAYASRRPDPRLQQIENFGDPTVTANDCFRPVSRWDRITRPEQLLAASARCRC